MRKCNLKLPIVFLLLALATSLAFGCAKGDNFERNMQYVSDELLYHDATQAWEQLNETHSRWSAAGASHDKDDAAFSTYADAYQRYAVIYNEIMTRQGVRFPARLSKVTDQLPPSPPTRTNRPAPVPAPQPAAGTTIDAAPSKDTSSATISEPLNLGLPLESLDSRPHRATEGTATTLRDSGSQTTGKQSKPVRP